jgi:hypothetical protein
VELVSFGGRVRLELKMALPSEARNFGKIAPAGEITDSSGRRGSESIPRDDRRDGGLKMGWTKRLACAWAMGIDCRPGLGQGSAGNDKRARPFNRML